MERRLWRSGEPRRSQHFLAEPGLARDLVRDAGIGSDDLAVDIGAGAGALTAPLAERAREVLAIELDAGLAAGLRRRFAAVPAVQVLEADVLDVDLPREPFKVVSNLPFHLSTPLLHHLLDDTRSRLIRADLLLSWGHAIGLTQVHPPPASALSWLPWFELLLTRRLPARFFRPVPGVDIGVVSIRRRQHPMLDPSDARQYRRFLREERVPNHDVWRSLAAFHRSRQTTHRRPSTDDRIRR